MACDRCADLAQAPCRMAEGFERRLLELPKASTGGSKRIRRKLLSDLMIARQANKSLQFGGGFELALMVRQPPPQ
jgi:hypothetical protein